MCAPLCQICSESDRIDLLPISDIKIYFLYWSENGGSETRWESESVFLGNSFLPIWQTNCLVNWEPNAVCAVCGGGGGVVKGERKEKVKRGRGWERDEANERVIPKHLRKHFPLSYHLDVVSGTRTANVFPLSTPPTFSCFWLFRRGKGTLGLYFFSLLTGTKQNCRLCVHVCVCTQTHGINGL